MISNVVISCNFEIYKYEPLTVKIFICLPFKLSIQKKGIKKRNKKMYPLNSFDNKPIVIKSKRGRKALAVSEGHMDVTGKTHIMTVRRTNPPVSRKKATTPKIIKQNNVGLYCKILQILYQILYHLASRICSAELRNTHFF